MTDLPPAHAGAALVARSFATSHSASILLSLPRSTASLVNPDTSRSSFLPTGEVARTRNGFAGVAALTLAVAAGDQRALAELYRWKLGMVIDWARRTTGRDEAFGLDVAQEAFVRVINARASLGRITDEHDLERWLLALTRSAALDLLRRELRRNRRELARSTGGQGATVDHHTVRELASLLSRLESETQDALRMRAHGSTLHQIATALGTTVGSVHGRIRRALQTLSDSERGSNHE